MIVVRRIVGFALVVAGVALALSPRWVADLLSKPHETSSQMINLRASWGGAVLGIGAFLAWLPAVKPVSRALIGLLMWSMAGVGVARTLGFVLDGSPDTRQFIWISAEAAIVVAGALFVVRRTDEH
jgi:hypothetical protein